MDKIFLTDLQAEAVIGIYDWEREIKQTLHIDLEMATDITQIRMLQDNLSNLGLMMSTLSHGIKGVLTGLDSGLQARRKSVQKDRAADHPS